LLFYYISPFFSSLFHIFSPNEIGWYLPSSPPREGGVFQCPCTTMFSTTKLTVCVKVNDNAGYNL
jgi:hypothetical protein